MSRRKDGITVNEAIDQSLLDQCRDFAIFISPPGCREESDADSADSEESSGQCISNLNRNQLNADAELVCDAENNNSSDKDFVIEPPKR